MMKRGIESWIIFSTWWVVGWLESAHPNENIPNSERQPLIAVTRNNIHHIFSSSPVQYHLYVHLIVMLIILAQTCHGLRLCSNLGEGEMEMEGLHQPPIFSSYCSQLPVFRSLKITTLFPANLMFLFLYDRHEPIWGKGASPEGGRLQAAILR